jgi:hypothetical protein
MSNPTLNLNNHATDDDITVTASNLSPISTPNDVANHSNATSISPTTATMGISDSGATGHFLQADAPVTNKRIAIHPIKITLPDGNKIESSHTCNLDIPWLPHETTAGHIVPKLTHTSLLATRQFCDNGCEVTFTKNMCKVTSQGKTVLQGPRDPHTKLWHLPINPTATREKIRPNRPATNNIAHIAMNAYTMPTKQQAIKYMHQTLFCPPIHTLITAIENEQLRTFPHLTVENVRKHLEPSSATAKGRIRMNKKGIRSTRKPRDSPNLPIPQANQVFCFTAMADKAKRTLYHDLTGRLPVMSLEGNQYFLVAYDYTINAILVRPTKDLESDTIIKAFDSIFQELKQKGFKPQLNITDNQAVTALKTYLHKENCEWQFVEPNNHRVNAAERAIQTFKNHFISGLCTTDKDFPLQLWDHMAEQAQDTLNLLRTSRHDPTKSAYEQLNGPYDFNKWPMAPPGTKAVIWESPTTRQSWAPRGIDAWYLGPSKDHYRLYKFYYPETQAIRVNGSAQFFPQHCKLPTLNPTQHADAVADELFESLKNLQNTKRKPLLRKIATKLEDIVTNRPPLAIQRVTTTNQQDTSEQRVDVPDTTNTSTNPTAPHIVATTPKTHQRKTRSNTPGKIALIEREQTMPIRRSPRQHQSRPTPTTTNYSNKRHHGPNIISQETAYHLAAPTNPRVWMPRSFLSACPTAHRNNFDVDIEHFASPVIHPVTGATITRYQKLVKDPILREVWTKAFGKEFGNLAQGDKHTNTQGTNSIFILSHKEIRHIPADRVVTYANIVVDYRPQKSDPNRVRITAGGNLIDYPGELTTRTADLSTAKIMWNSVLSTTGAKFMGLDIGSFYLETPLARYEYMKFPIALFPQHVIEQYNLATHVHKGFIYVEIRKAIYGLPQAGILANQLLRKRLAPAGYYEVAHTPGLWRHVSRPIQFSLVVDDFGVKYVGKQHADHLITTLRKHYKLSEDWEGALYCGITLDWDYQNRTLDISMPNYVSKLLTKFQHKAPNRPQHSPHRAPPKKYGTAAHDPIPPDTTPPINAPRIKTIQQVIGGILYYARAVDLTVLPALSAIASDQAKATEATEAHVKQLLDYLTTHPMATIRYHRSDMILNIHSDASYLSETRARSRVAGHFFLGATPTNNQPIELNGAIYTLCGILKIVVASAAEAELGALFMNIKEGVILRLILTELGHKQPPTPVHCDNQTATGIANDTVKKQRSRSMEMRFFWICDQVKRQFFKVYWHPGQENLADYFTKHFDAKHHQAVRQWYIYAPGSPRQLPRAVAPSTLRGCVGTLPNGYVRTSPLPRLTNNRVPREQITSTPSTCKPTGHTGRTSVRIHGPVTTWPHNNSIAIRANHSLGNRSNRLIIV